MTSIEQFDSTFYDRTARFITAEGVKKLQKSTVAIAGCGGYGGSVLVTLARLGIGSFILAEPNNFDNPDLNRQWGATLNTIGKNKALVYEEYLKSLNPDIKVRTYTNGLTLDNVEEFLDGATIAIDGLDVLVPTALRKKYYNTARKKGIYCMVGPLIGMGAALVVSDPNGMPLDFMVQLLSTEESTSQKFPDFLYHFYNKAHLDLVSNNRVESGKIPSLSLSINLISCATANECLMILLKDIMPGWREPLVLPKMLFMDTSILGFNVVDASLLFK